jgi:hypothetical protein
MLLGINLKLPRPAFYGPGYIYHDPRILQEDGFALLLEDGGYLLLESVDSSANNLQMENGANLLLEDLDFLLLET